MQSTPIINSLVGGVLSPKLAGRSDVQQYFQSASLLDNILVECYGGGKNRPGTYFCAETKHQAKSLALSPLSSQPSKPIKLKSAMVICVFI